MKRLFLFFFLGCFFVLGLLYLLASDNGQTNPLAYDGENETLVSGESQS